MRIAAVSLLVASLALTACDDTNLIDPFPRTGTYVLSTVNGQALPVIVADEESPPLRVEVLSGAIRLNTNNTYADETVLRETVGGIVSTRTVACAGTWTRSGNTISFTESSLLDDCVDNFTGVLGDRSLSTTIRGMSAVYVR